MKRKQKTIIEDGILLVTGDTHTNSRGGLMPPYVKTISGNEVKGNDVQRFLWRSYKVCLDACEQVIKRHKLPVIIVINGDSVDKNKHDTWDRISNNPVDIVDIAAKTLSPLLDLSDCWYIIKGTEAHTGKHGWLEDGLAKDLGAEKNGHGYAYSHKLLNIGGVIFDIRHHTESNSTRPWTKGGGAMRSAKMVQDYYYDSGDKPPDWAIRGHVHHFEDSGRNFRTRTIFLPSWQAPGHWIQRIGLGPKLPEFGMGYWVCKGGRVVEWDLLEVKVRRDKPQKPEVMS